MIQSLPGFSAVGEYWLDAWQRSVLFLDVLRERGNIYQEQTAKDGSACADLQGGAACATAARWSGRSTTRWCASCRRPARKLDPTKPPIIVVDPRAGHGPGHRRHEAGQRDRRGAGGRPSLLLHRLPAEADAGPDDRGCLPRRGDLRRGRGGAPSRRRGQADHHRQLPGRLADHDDGGDQARPDRTDHAGRLAAVLLGRRARQEPACAISAACSAAPG